ncbi:Aste57867_10487 [Aphanomyces stellatus]|uniref:Aste57867_10487 protein n=1 Tax=Aphanomyces stellatus TaxID=120398 RepID=A0A485KR01_9STRA|nr:hypothetical protein As57867_010447 [Aphanomyces stellatus]VFT87361.1 Aste57867_10487 [Aphanomyces stellatus]
MTVGPTPTSPQQPRRIQIDYLSKSKVPKRHLISVVAALSYLVFTLSASIWYIETLYPMLNNDVYWPYYNANTHEVFLIDLINTKLLTTRNGPADLLSLDAVKTYTSGHAQPTFEPNYARRVLFTEMNTLEKAVLALRASPPSTTNHIVAQFCWVDFDRRWEVAHTDARQARCLARYKNNAANYQETLFRNIDWHEWLALNGATWWTTFGNALRETPAGVDWLADRPRFSMQFSATDEVKYLTSINLTRYDLQYHNEFYLGLTESMQIQNTLGLTQSITIKSVPDVWGTWTTWILLWNFPNELATLASFNASFVRGSTYYFGNSNYALLGGLDFTTKMYGLCDENGTYRTQSGLFYYGIGAFGSVDTLYVAPPPSLFVLYSAILDLLHGTIVSTKQLTIFRSMGDFSLAPLPPNFKSTEMTYFGGNLLCLYNSPTLYPQSQFYFEDPCASSNPFIITATKKATVFALLASGHAHSAAICAFQTTNGCVAFISTAQQILVNSGINTPNIQTLVAQTMRDVPPADFVQYAQNATGDWLLLQQPLLTLDPNWSFYGWLALFDWMESKREIIRLEGDASTVTFISEPSTPVQLVHTSNSEGLTGNRMIYYFLVYSTGVSVAIGIGILFYSVRTRWDITVENFFLFNRVVGSVWIGRPLLLLRGLTAILMLSTSQTTLVQTTGITFLEFNPRSLLATLFVAGEATWVTYVMSDILLISKGQVIAISAPLASGFVWLITSLVSQQAPILLTARIHRQCTVGNIDAFLTCDSAVIAVGDSNRFVLLLAVQVISVGVSVALGMLWSHRWPSHPAPRAPLLLHGTAERFYKTRHINSNRGWNLDDVSCLMSGLVPFSYGGKLCTFDIKLWILIHDGGAGNRKSHPMASTFSVSFRKPKSEKSNSIVWPSETIKTPVPVPRPRFSKVMVFVGFVYVISSAIGSISYIVVSTVNFANDFYWATFNLTGHHAVIADFINEQVALNRSLMNFRWDEPRWATMDSHPNTHTFAPPWIAQQLQIKVLNTVSSAIQGLRNTDACSIPWMFSQYCWVDFNRQWPMANSAARQVRCDSNIANGAVYLESVLRNTDWQTFESCWGNSFEVAFGAELQRSLVGQSWIKMIQTNSNSLSDEVAYWVQVGITSFIVQWQNFKTLGLINTYMIENTFGVQYPMTLTRTNGSFRLASQTSFKMYWSLACDLWAVSANSTLMAQMSLIRNSSNYAFANQSMMAVLVQNTTLTLPLGQAFTLVQSELGPFGSIDMFNIPCPASVKTLMTTSMDIIRTAISESKALALAFAAVGDGRADNFHPMPQLFLDVYGWGTFGGNLLCDGYPGGAVSLGLNELTSRTYPCAQSLTLDFKPTIENYVMATLASGISQADIDAACTHVQYPDLCASEYLVPALTFAIHGVSPQFKTDILGLADGARKDVWAAQVSLIQYVQQNTSQPMLLMHYECFDPSDPTFNFWSWLFAFEWALGTREVVSFQGDAGSLNVLTHFLSLAAADIQPNQLPTILTVYTRSGVQYVTGVMIGVATGVVLYTLTSRGAIEGWNIFELNRVAGIVWVGRPLLFVRGITALCLLSTATLELTQNQIITTFNVHPLVWYKTILGASEATWLVYVLNDILMVYTQSMTMGYASTSSLLVWIFSAILTLADPVKHSATIEPTCVVDAMDFQLVCQSGVVVIGQFRRLVWLLGIIGVCNVLSFVAVRTTHVYGAAAMPPHHSLLLSSGAKYLFQVAAWTHNNVYYMDPSSALLNGLVSCRWHKTIFVLDIKLWRIFAITHDHERLPRHFDSAIPLTE